MGGTSIEQPQQPSVQSSISDYVQNYPALFSLQQQYAPQEAAQQVALAQQYAAPLGEAYRTAQEQIYPNETALSNELTAQAREGMSSTVPEWQKAQYQSDLNANLGSNVGSGIGADYMSRGMQQQQQDWQRYYQNMGLSIAGRQPIATASTPTTTNVLQGYTPQGVMNYNASNYGTAANIYGTQSQQSNPWMSMAGTLGGAALGGWSTNWGK
jgi:hypothetical protein